MPIQRLVEGIHHFQANAFRSQRELFEHLAHGQSPDTLFITCSDSRIDPNLITRTRPGELFIMRNAGNIIPRFGEASASGGEAPTIEFAVVALGVRDVVVCGHSQCGAVKGLLHPDKLIHLPTVAAWLYHAEATRRIMFEKYQHCTPAELLTATIEENVLVQLENLATHPAVAEAIRKGKLNLHGWVYDIQTGEVFAYDPGAGQFVPIGSVQVSDLAKKLMASEGSFEAF
jgi:carbonic anhydrase